MSGIGIAISPCFDSGGESWESYWANHNNYWAKTRSGNTIPDSINGNDARILPAVYVGNSSGYYPYYSLGFFSSDDWVLYLDIELLVNSNQNFISQGASMYFRLNASVWYFVMNDGTYNRNISISAVTLPITARKYTFKITHDKDGSTTIYEGGVQVGTASGTFTNLPTAGTAKYVYYGYNGTTGGTMTSNGILISSRVYSDLTEVTLVANYIFTGSSSIYDISGNNRNIAGQSIVAANKSYSINGSTYLLDSGWTLWQHPTTADIIMPYGCTTSPIAAGYTITKAYAGSATKINMAPCLIGFNETSSAAAELEIFDRSNVTRQTAASRASSYYVSTNLATKSRYHISELHPYEKFLTWFETDYQDRIFCAMSKTGTDFSLTEFVCFDEKLTSTWLANIKTYCEANMSLTIGTTKNFTSPLRACAYAYPDYTITIDAGTYTEVIDLSTKRLNLVGLGTLSVIFQPGSESVPSPSAFVIGTNSTFNNIVFDNKCSGNSPSSIIDIDACNPIFTNCKVGQFTAGKTTYSLYPMDIATGSVVTMSNCIVETGVGNQSATNGYSIVVHDTSILNFEGTYFKAKLNTLDTSVANIDTDELWIDDHLYVNISPEDDSEIYLTVNTRSVHFATGTITELTAGTYSRLATCIDNAYLEITGNEIHAGAVINGDGVHVVFNNITSTLGACGATILNTVSSVNTILVEFNNCDIKIDIDNHVSGLHLIEFSDNGEVWFNNCTIEWTGDTGSWWTMGCSLYGYGKLYMRDCILIDNVNDIGYYSTIAWIGLVDLEDTVIIQQGYVSGDKTIPISMNVYTGCDWKLRLKNVDIDNDSQNTNIVSAVNKTRAIAAGDYACVENLTHNSTAAIYYGDGVDDLTEWNWLLSQCP